MRRTSVVLIALAMAVSACGSDSGTEPTPELIDPGTLRLQIVSGAHQTGRVASSASVAALPAGLSLQALPGGLLPEPLVARIVTESGARVQMDAVGATTVVVTFRVVPPVGLPQGDPRHCGESFVDSAIPDSQGEVTTYWEEPTIADYDCVMQVRLVVDGTPRVDTVFVSRMEPGEPHRIEAPELVRMVEGDTSRAIHGVWDRHGNSVPSEVVVRGDAAVAGDLYALIGAEWGTGEYDLIVADTVVATGTVAVLPRIEWNEPWVWELACQTPDTLYVDRIEGESRFDIDWTLRPSDGIARQRAAMAARGLDPDRSVPTWVSGTRTIIAGTDTISIRDLPTAAGEMFITADTTDLVLPDLDPVEILRPVQWRAYRDHREYLAIEDVPMRLPLVSRAPLTWQSTDAAAACVSDGWTNATAGTLTIRALE